MMRSFYEPKKNRKKTRTFGTEFEESDQSVETNARGLFPFYGSTKKSKNKPPIDFTVSTSILARLKNDINLSDNDF